LLDFPVQIAPVWKRLISTFSLKWIFKVHQLYLRSSLF